MIGLIGATGVIGQLLQQSMFFDQLFDSKNIATVINYDFDVLYCSAPTGNRLLANSDPEQDQSNIMALSRYLTQAQAQRVVLISTVDTLVKTTPYAKNRKFLEEQIQTLPNSIVIRLCSLVGKPIKKNLLYDLKHNQYIENINLHDFCQWYPLEYLANDIEQIISSNESVVNLVSEPIENITIVKQFASKYISLMQDLGQNYYDIKPYRYSADEIFYAMEKYFAD